MLFNSHAFLLGFLPVVLGVAWLLGRRGLLGAARLWLASSSLFFYGWWNPRYLPLLLVSIAFNYAVGRWLGESPRARSGRGLVLGVGVAANLLALGWFKYAHFVAGELARVSGADVALPSIVLPLAISFFTFQQIAWLVEQWRAPAGTPGWLDYLLFVAFFPQLIAGPIVQAREMLPQFARAETFRLRRHDLEVGSAIFAVGLFQKVVLADGIAIHATRVFEQVSLGASPDLFAAWTAALAFTFQLFFDFAGYSDMAIGLARMFGIRLPLNFDAPYRATSIIDFWRRWHMTLSRFLRDYLYIPLGGGRRGPWRRYLNLLVTMVLGGLWHGAGWTFVAWGALHGVYLLIAHAWRALRGRGAERAPGTTHGASAWAGRVLTFLAVVVGWVIFRAATLDDAFTVFAGMAGRHGAVWPDGGAVLVLQLAALLAIVWFVPPTHVLFAAESPALAVPRDDAPAPAWLRWRPTPRAALVVALLTVAGVLGINRYSEFLYFQF